MANAADATIARGPLGKEDDAAASDASSSWSAIAILKGIWAKVNAPVKGDYETVAASQSDQVLGATGAAGDFLAGLLIVPATTSPAAVSIKDGGGSSITVFTGGASSVSNLTPFFIPLGMRSASGAWKVTTGANVSAIGVGSFT